MGDNNTDDTGTDEGTDDQSTGTDDAGDGQDKGKGDDEPRFTQKQLDDAIRKRLGREKRKSSNGKARPFDQDDDDDDDDPKSKAQAERVSKLEERLLKASAKDIAIDELDVDRKKVRAVLRMADLKGLGPDDEDEIKDAIQEVLEDFPGMFTKADEPKTDPPKDDGKKDEGKKDGKPKQSTRDDSTDDKGTKQWTRAEIADLASKNPAEYEKQRDAIHKALSLGQVK